MRRKIIYGTAALLLAATAAQAGTDFLAINGILHVPTYTVAGLPAGTLGAIAYVTDQLTACPVLDGTFTGGGSVKCFATYNGTAWVHN